MNSVVLLENSGLLPLPSTFCTTSMILLVTSWVFWPRKRMPATVMIKNRIGPIDEMA